MVSCWGITDGSAGMVAQVRALAGALGLSPEMKKIALNKMFAWQPNAMYAAGFRDYILTHALNIEASDSLLPPWPDLIISCGRKSALITMGMRYMSQGAGIPTRYIHIQDPQAPAKYFDIVIAMMHDKINGPNVGKVRFALHRITPQLLHDAREKFTPRFAIYAKPYVCVLLGGGTNKYDFTAKAMTQVIASLDALLRQTTGSLLITPSRRTGAENIAALRAHFKGNSRVYVYDMAEENPYLGMLALADTLVVTNDSVNMMSEAHATGKPLYILPLPGHRGTKPAGFADELMEDGIARPLGKKLESWEYPVIDEMALITHDIRLLVPLP